MKKTQKDTQKTKPIKIILTIIVTILIITIIYEYKTILSYDRYRDYIQDLDQNLLHTNYDEQGNQHTINNLTDYEKAIILMNYAHYNIAGVCFDKSNGFEILARNEGLKTEHIALISQDKKSTHAISRIKINNTWVYIDSYYGRITNPQELHDMGYATMIRTINCYDGDCTNYSPIERWFLMNFYIRKIINVMPQ